MKIPNALRPAAIGKLALTAAVVAAAVARLAALGALQSNPDPRRPRQGLCGAGRADVSGLVTDVPVHDNQDVKAGDVLFEIDRARFQLAYDQAQASVRSQQVARKRCATPSATARWASWSRRKPWNRARPAAADRGRAGPGRGAVEQRAPEPERSRVLAATDGRVTNLDLRAGAYATAGRGVMALVDSARSTSKAISRKPSCPASTKATP